MNRLRSIPRGVRVAAQVGVTVLAYTLLLQSLDAELLLTQLGRAHHGWLALAVALPLVGIAISALRWSVLLAGLGQRRSFRRLLQHYWQGSFYNTVLPGSVGGDVVRVGALAGDGVPLGLGSVSVVADRIVGLCVALSIGLVAGLWPSALPHRSLLTLVFGAILAASGLVAVALWGSRRRLPAWLAALITLLGQPRQLAAFLLLVALFQALVVVHLFVVGRALLAPLPLLACGLYMPAVVLFTLVPVSLNGLGIREMSLVVLLGGIDIAPETAALIGFVLATTSTLSSLPGSLVLLKHEVRQHNDRTSATL